MKQIVKLTESDLVRLVKRVIKEQHYNTFPDEKIAKLGYKRIDKIGIWVEIAGQKIMYDVFAKQEDLRGCFFLGTPRSVNNVSTLNFQCTNPTKLVSYRVVGGKSETTPLIISKEAGDRLINACGCKNYVKTDMVPSGQDYV